MTEQWEEIFASGENVVSGTFHLNETPWYPFTIAVSDNCNIVLNADGKWEGSIEALRQVMAEGKSNYVDGNLRVMLWLILREMERDKRFW
jgi:hypothetical protein